MGVLGDAEHTMLGSVTLSHVGVAALGTPSTGYTCAAEGVKLKNAGHTFIDKDLVYLNSVAGGSLLKAKRAYWVKKVSGTEVELFPKYDLTGTAEKVGTEVTDASLSKIEEASGGAPAYARIACTYATAANRKRLDSTEHEVNVKAGQVVDLILGCGAETGIDKINMIAEVTKETFVGQGVYKVKEGQFDLLAAA